MSTITTRKLFTVHDYYRMAETGILSERDRVELINGEIFTMSPIGPRHCAGVDRLAKFMMNLAGDRAIVRTQGSVRLNELSEPQPDIVLLLPKDDFYASKHPGPADILLIAEVSQSSLEYDRTIKAQLYAEMGITEYWVEDLENDYLFAFSDPVDGSYQVVRELHRGDSITPILLPDCRFQISDLLP